jgi:hypothetical protein
MHSRLDFKYKLISNCPLKNINKGESGYYYRIIRNKTLKEEINLEQTNLLVWYDYEKNNELWFLIKANKKMLKKYLSNNLSLLDLMRYSKVFLYKRNYNNI